MGRINSKTIFFGLYPDHPVNRCKISILFAHTAPALAESLPIYFKKLEAVDDLGGGQVGHRLIAIRRGRCCGAVVEMSKVCAVLNAEHCICPDVKSSSGSEAQGFRVLSIQICWCERRTDGSEFGTVIALDILDALSNGED